MRSTKTIFEYLQTMKPITNKQITRLSPLSFVSLEDSPYYTANSCAKHISQMLDITKPDIRIYPIVLDNPTKGQGCLPEPKYFISDGFSVENVLGGLFVHEKNIVLLGYYDIFNGGKPYMEFEIIFNMAHELRHVYQYQHKKRTYYSRPNAGTADEYLIDKSEIDADAFAIAYLSMLGHGKGVMTIGAAAAISMDNGKRLDSARKLYAEYFK